MEHRAKIGIVLNMCGVCIHEICAVCDVWQSVGTTAQV